MTKNYIKNKIYFFRYLLLFIGLLSINNYAQNITENHQGDLLKSYSSEYSLNQLANHNYNYNDINKKIDWNTFYNANKGGMTKLQLDIKNNPSKYPMQTLEDKSKFEPDAFRRWEYQMRKMQVEIVSPNKNILQVDFKTTKNVTFCKTNSFNLSINIKNVSGFDLPIFYFMITDLPGVTIDEKKLKLPKDVTFIKAANTFIFNKEFKKDNSAKIDIYYNVGCDGRGGSPVLKEKSKIVSNLNWELNLIGYLLDYDKRKLYKVIDFGNKPKTIQFNNQTKY